MFGVYKKYSLFILVLIFFLFDIFLFYQDFENIHKNFIFAMLDVGQGDALFIESPTGTKVMFDGGGFHKVLGSLSKILSPLNKKIDALVITNPDSDHIAGFLDILKSYKVDYVFEPGTINDSKTYQNLKQEINRQHIPDILLKKGMVLNLGDGLNINILFPDRDVSTWTSNDGSVVARLSYDNYSIMLTGDATSKTEKIILAENSDAQLSSTVLKVGHHGSRTSTSLDFVKAVSPQYAFISDGKDNKYGHPHKETLDTLNRFGVKILRTDLLGTIIVECDRIKICKLN